jgi:hypothetical protein
MAVVVSAREPGTLSAVFEQFELEVVVAFLRPCCTADNFNSTPN